MTRHPIAFGAAVCLSIAAATLSAAAITAERVALSGDSATGVSGATFTSFDNAYITAAGDAWFNATTSQIQSSYAVKGLWYKSGAVSLVAKDNVPGGFRLSSFGNQVMSTSLVVYLDEYTGNGIYAGSPGSVTVVSKQNNTAPDAGAGVQFDYPSSFGRTVNASGRMAEVHVLKGTGVTGTNAAALYAGTASDFHLVARQGATFTAFHDVRINSAGLVNANVVGTGNNSGIWQGNTSADFHQVVAKGQAATGIAGATFSEFQNASAVNASGQIAFIAKASGQSSTNEHGLWTTATSGNVLQLVARTGSAADGISDGARYATQFGYNSTVKLTNNGRIVFGAGLTNTVEGRNSGAWYGPAGALQLLAREGDANNLLGGHVVLDDLAFTNFAINNNGLVAFVNGLVTQVGFTSEITSNNDRALFAWSEATGLLTLLAREGNVFDIGGGVMKTIASFNSVTGSAGNDGQAFSLNDAGELVVAMAFTDSSSGVFKLNLSSLNVSAVPEPGTTALLIGTGVFVSVMAIRRRRRAG